MWSTLTIDLVFSRLFDENHLTQILIALRIYSSAPNMPHISSQLMRFATVRQVTHHIHSTRTRKTRASHICRVRAPVDGDMFIFKCRPKNTRAERPRALPVRTYLNQQSATLWPLRLCRRRCDAAMTCARNNFRFASVCVFVRDVRWSYIVSHMDTKKLMRTCSPGKTLQTMGAATKRQHTRKRHTATTFHCCRLCFCLQPIIITTNGFSWGERKPTHTFTQIEASFINITLHRHWRRLFRER